MRTVNLKHVFIVLVVFLVSISFTGCRKNTEKRNQLSELQTLLLNTPASASTVRFNENGVVTALTIGDVNVSTHLTQHNKGGMFGGDAKYYKDKGTVYYNSTPSEIKIVIYADSEDPYRSTSYPSSQSVIVSNGTGYDAPRSSYVIDFNQTPRARTIDGVSYSDVYIGVYGYAKDTLFWKKDIGILGWKRSDVSWTAYRVF